MSKVHHTVFRSEHYKLLKKSVDDATELNEINVSKRYYSDNVSKRYYSDNVEQSQNKTFSHYLLEQLIKNFGSDYYYRTEVVETFTPVKSTLNKQLQSDQDPLNGLIINDFKHLFLINADYIKGLYQARFDRFEEADKLLEYLKTYPTIDYLFEYSHVSHSDAVMELKKLMK